MEAKSFARFSKCDKPSLSVELQVRLQLLEANWAENPDTALSLLFGAVHAVHQALIVDAVLKSEHVTDLVNHGTARTLHPNLF